MAENFIDEINDGISKNEYLMSQGIKIIKIQYLKKSNKVRVVVRAIEYLDKEEETVLLKIIKTKINFIENFEVICYKDVSNIDLGEICTKYWVDVVSNISNILPICGVALSSAKKQVVENNINLKIPNQFIINHLKSNKIDNTIKKKIKDLFDIDCGIEFSLETAAIDYFENKELENKEIIKNVLGDKPLITKKPESKVVEKKDYRKIAKENKVAMDDTVIFGKKISGQIVDIKDIDQASGTVVVKGDIFKIDIIETKSGRKIITAYITDYTSSIIAKIFPREKDEDTLIEGLKKGMHCIIRGEANFDLYAKEVVISCRDINTSVKELRKDNSGEKRVELHAHTQMSAMDGMTSISKLIERAAKWGHQHIAITDHGVVQAFPEAMEAAKKYKINVIYGIEAYLVDDGEPITIGDDDKLINSTFVVFDLETTGLSSLNDSIIEIGAVKILNGEVIDTFSTFVNPSRLIPYKITELTGINDEMVIGAPFIDSAIDDFFKFTNGSVVVAHNAPFDSAFIKKACKDKNIKFDNSIMDTIPLCKYLFPELKRYKLDVVCKYIGISLENHHRAIDDAMATAKILLHSFNLLKERGIENLKNLNEIYLKNQDIKKLPTYHLIILVKNQVGLKNLYKLVSKSNLDYFFKRPRMPKSEILKLREGLIIGSACEAGQVFRGIMGGKNDNEMNEILSFYDYLEIQPTANNKFMLAKGSVKSIEDLQELNKRVIELGEKNNLPVVATGDIHFLDENDAVFRKILMAGQGFSDADDQAPLYFKTTEEMLKEFSYLGEELAKKVVIEAPNYIANLIEAVKPIPDGTFVPKIEGAEDELREMTLKKVYSIYGETLPEVVQKRLDKELNSIINNGYAVLYLIAQKLVAKSYADGYLVGSRGSVGSSFVATMAGITEVNGLPPHYVCPNCKNSEFFTDGSISSGADLPDKKCPVCDETYIKDGHDIPFETFLGFEGDKEPDIDLNFSGDNQADIHKYTEVLFGKGFTFKAGTIGTIADKTAYGFVKKYIDGKGLVYSSAEIERLTQGCTGVKRTSGQHPGGIMVVPADNEIYNFTPVQRPADDPNSEIVTTHFDYHSISGRLLKLDILGHDDPTVLKMLQDLTGIDPKSIPLGDEKVMSLFTSTKALGITKEELDCEVGTYGLPEFGTKFVRQMLLDTKPKTFADIVRISGLSHGTDVWINNAQYYIKEGYTTLKDCISTRDDIMVYLIYQGLEPKSAFNIMERVRKGKGVSEEQETLMKENSVPNWYIESCKKIKYMFPKGHAVAYCMMAIRIAFFKVYYPREYYTTYFTVRASDFDANLIIKGEGFIKGKIDELYTMQNLTVKDKGFLTTLEISYEMYKRGIKFLKVDLYKSHPTKFTIEDGDIRIPINALGGIGENAAKSIAETRVNCIFISKEDLRIKAKVSKSVIEMLDSHGSLIGLPDTNQLSLFSM